jgi:putative cell wall-binding protein
LANGSSYPDGLAASVIAGHRDGVILFTNKDELPLATDRFLSEFDVQRVTIIGGTAVVSDALAQSLMSRGIVVDRLAGATRYETADAVASAALIEDGQYVPLYKGKKYLFIASGQNFPDAVAAGSAAYVGSYPLILASSGGLSSASLEIVVAWYRSNPAGRVMILGGTAAVPALVETQLRENKRPWVEGTDGYFGGDFCDNYPYDWPHCPIDEIPEPITRVSRLAGADRFMTAWAIANWARSNVFTSTSGDVGLATGLEFSNALAAVPLLGQELFQGPLLLTSRCTHLPSATRLAAGSYSTQRLIGSDIDLCDYDAKVLAGGS